MSFTGLLVPVPSEEGTVGLKASNVQLFSNGSWSCPSSPSLITHQADTESRQCQIMVFCGTEVN